MGKAAFLKVFEVECSLKQGSRQVRRAQSPMGSALPKKTQMGASRGLQPPLRGSS